MGLRFTTRAIEPVSLQEAIQGLAAPWCLHAGRETILQEGVVARIEARGPDRCAFLREQAAAYEPEGAVWMGGLAFAPDHDAAGPWSGFPAGSFSLPKRQLRWQDGILLETTCDAPVLPAVPARPGTDLAPSTRAGWHQDVAQVEEAIRDGVVEKVVLARCEATRPIDARRDLLRLIDAEEGLAFAYDTGHATFYGLSPERLVGLRAGHVTTHALAGSGPAGGGERLLMSSKDVREHEFVAAFVRQKLLQAGVRDVESETRRVRSMRHVQHLETPIAGKAPGMHVLELVSALHPTPAVCGTPTEASRELIARLEGFPRGWYSGAVGWFDAQGQGEFAVALRCALQTPDARYLFAGAGIVAGSEPEAEWAETGSKLATLREAS